MTSTQAAHNTPAKQRDGDDAQGVPGDRRTPEAAGPVRQRAGDQPQPQRRRLPGTGDHSDNQGGRDQRDQQGCGDRVGALAHDIGESGTPMQHEGCRLARGQSPRPCAQGRTGQLFAPAADHAVEALSVFSTHEAGNPGSNPAEGTTLGGRHRASTRSHERSGAGLLAIAQKGRYIVRRDAPGLQHSSPCQEGG
ncbi:hypothetical protein GCM10010339_88280 [Streptomyces alanosinicus]|uniref:Uncharacterized protein n=1 Tax=Streptomyces alanosinicus TaxID=68171 RepID=A0A918YTU6_9ACTN|nr:hypothetical protein GCM10010339_88280 [Streptomyces alanosinicus]